MEGSNRSRPRGVGAGLLWAILVPVVAFLLLMICGLGVFAISLLTGGNDTPFKGTAWQVPFITLGIISALILLLARVASRLIAAVRGKEVDNIIPPIVQLAFSLFFGLFGVGAMIAALLGKGGARIQLGICIVFLGHAAHVLRKMWIGRTLSPRLDEPG